MATRTPKKDLRNQMSDHLDVLRSYAERAVARGETLTPDEENDRDTRFKKFAKIGGTLKLTESDMVSLMLKGLFEKQTKCGCFQCRTRR